MPKNTMTKKLTLLLFFCSTPAWAAEHSLAMEDDPKAYYMQDQERVMMIKEGRKTLDNTRTIAELAGLDSQYGIGELCPDRKYSYNEVMNLPIFRNNAKALLPVLRQAFGGYSEAKRRQPILSPVEVARIVRRGLGREAFKNESEAQCKERRLGVVREDKLQLLNGRLDQWFNFLHQVTEDKQLLQRSFLWVFGGLGVAFFVYFFCKHAIPMILSWLFHTKPQIIESTTIPMGFTAVIKNKFLGAARWIGLARKQGKSGLENLHYEPHLHLKIHNLIRYDRTRVRRFHNKKAKQLAFHHMLLVGPPGTGKTSLMEAYAQEAGFDFVRIGGARWAQMSVEEALQDFYNLLKIARANKRPVLIFVDEVESLFRKRSDADQLAKKVTSAFLEMTPKPFDQKIKWVFATNLPDQLDGAVLSRVSERVFVGKPSAEVCEKLLSQYLEQYCKKYGLPWPKPPKDFGKNLEGWVGRDIENLCDKLASEAAMRGETLTLQRIQQEIDAKNADQKEEQSQGKGWWE